MPESIVTSLNDKVDSLSRSYLAKPLALLGVAVIGFLPPLTAWAEATLPKLAGAAEYYSENNYFAIEKLNDQLYAISEPSYYQKNFSYLIVGADQALLVDAGASWTENLKEVVRSITEKDVSVVPTHLHFDHIGSLPRFDDIWMIGLPSVQSLGKLGDQIVIPEIKSLGAMDGHGDMNIQVSRYLEDGETVDLGNLEVGFEVAQGHSLEEIIIHIPSQNTYLTGDHLYPDVLVVGDIDAYANSVAELVGQSDPETLFLGAHGSRAEPPASIPRLRYDEVNTIATKLGEIRDEKITGEPLKISGFIQSSTFYPVSERIGILTDVVTSAGRAYRH